jgi:hypothetical protein
MTARAPLLATLAGLLTLASCGPDEDGFASARRIQRLDEAIGGPKAAARVGDYLLENRHLRVAILASETPDGNPRNSMGPGLFGGSLVDADLQRPDPRFSGGRGLDHFAELFPTASLNVPEPVGPDAVRIVNDGADGNPAIIRVEGEATPFLSLLSALWAITDVPDMRLVTDYIAEPDTPWLRMRTAVRVGPSANAAPFGDAFPAALPATTHTAPFPLIERAISDGLILGDFFLVGGSVQVFAPGMGFDEDGLVARANAEGRNSFAEPFVFPWLAGVGNGVSYGIMPAEGLGFVPLFTSSQTTVVGGSVQGDPDAEDRFRDGDTFSYERFFLVGHGDVGSIYDQVLQIRGTPAGRVTGRVVEEGTGLALSGVNVFVFEPGAEYPTSQWRTDVRREDTILDGSFAGTLPAGTWEVLVHRPGRPDPERRTIVIEEGGELDLTLVSPRPGTVSFTLSDETGMAVPGKVTFLRVDGDSRRRPELGDGFIAGSPEAVVFPMYGDGIVELPDGEYVAVASRGLEYEIDEQGPFRVDATRAHHLDFMVERSVQTEGWISADFHVHAAPSHDSGVLLEDRVRSMVAEGVEFFSGTDHDVITDYAPVVERLGMEPWVQTAVGVETTTVELGHFLSFPLEKDFTAESGGALDWTGQSPYEIMTRIRQQGDEAGTDPLIFVGHPRAGILGYFDQYGVSPYGGIPGVAGTPGQPLIQTPTLSITNPLLIPSNVDLSFDALEIAGTKEMFRIRTATGREVRNQQRFLETGESAFEVTMADQLERTREEQQALIDGTYGLSWGQQGQLDDWFSLLNLGFRYTALANSDTHSMTKTEAGCPRNFVMSVTDDPGFIADQDVADAVKAGRVVASYGPFVTLTLDEAIIGDTLVSDAGRHTVTVEVQAPSWMDVDRVELYENGTLIHDWVVEGDEPQRFTGTHEVTPDRDSWYVAIAVGDESLAPVFTPVERPIIDLQVVVVDALSSVPAVGAFLDPVVPLPELFPITAFAVTNPIWVDQAGDGFDAPGIPDWMVEPETPDDD